MKVTPVTGRQLRLRKLWFGCGFLVMILVAVASLAPVPEGPELNDKVVHIIIYTILSAWFSLIVARTASLRWVFIGLVGYGILIELLQGMTAYRSLEIADAIANSIGAALGLICYFTPLRRWLIKLDYQLAASR